jgi:hypothetical protein
LLTDAHRRGLHRGRAAVRPLGALGREFGSRLPASHWVLMTAPAATMQEGMLWARCQHQPCDDAVGSVVEGRRQSSCFCAQHSPGRQLALHPFQPRRNHGSRQQESCSSAAHVPPTLAAARTRRPGRRKRHHGAHRQRRSSALRMAAHLRAASGVMAARETWCAHTGQSQRPCGTERRRGCRHDVW